MNWLKRNRTLGGVAAVAVIGLVAFCLWSRANDEQSGKLASVSVAETAGHSDQPRDAAGDFRRRYGLTDNAPKQTAEQASKPVQQIRVTFRAVMLERTAPGTSMSDADFAYALEKELKNSPLFDSQETELNPAITRDEASGTFSFGAKLVLKQPIKL